MLATKNGHQEIVEYLVTEDGDVNYQREVNVSIETDIAIIVP